MLKQNGVLPNTQKVMVISIPARFLGLPYLCQMPSES